MRVNTLGRLLLPLGIGLWLAWLIGSSLSAAPAPPVASTLGRPNDPVIITGTHFPIFSGTLNSDLVLYAYRSAAWTPIPFQIDEVHDISRTFVVSDGGRLDPNDELVFMAIDAGGSVTASVWPDDAQSKLNPRYAVSVTDPLNPGSTGWVYLYRSTTLTRTSASYMTWHEVTQTATGISYTAVFSPAKIVGLYDLKINGSNVDILDRQKIRGTYLIFFSFNEETLAGLSPAPLTLPAAGPIRAATNEGDLRAAFYGSRIEFDVRFDLSALLGTVNSIRTSFDWNNPITTGLTTYYDSNTPAGAAIDGVADPIATTPPITWFQVNGGPGGPGGMVFAITRVDPNGGALTNYYKDSSAIDAGDLGDRQSFGDTGVKIDGPGNAISFTMAAYVLPPGANSNVGAAYFARVSNPLVASAAEENYLAPAPKEFIYLPVVMKNHP